MKHAGNGHNSAWGILGSLDDDGTTSTNCCADFSYCLIIGEIPGRKGGTYANGLTDDHLSHSGVTGRNDTAIDASTLLGVPVRMVCATANLAYRLVQRFTLIQSDIAANFLCTLTAELPHFAQNLSAFHGRAMAPSLECLMCSLQGIIQVRLGGMRQLTKYLAVGRVNHILGISALGIQKLTVDVKSKGFVHSSSKKVEVVKVYSSVVLKSLRRYLNNC